MEKTEVGLVLKLHDHDILTVLQIVHSIDYMNVYIMDGEGVKIS